MRTRSTALFAVALLLATPSFAATNFWTKTTSGNWEEPFWFLGELPSSSHEAIVFNNAGSKALAIGSSTVANYPGSLRLNTLYVDAPPESHNVLLLNYAGLSVPLTTTATYIGRGASLLSYSSGLRANQLAVNGKATFSEFAESEVGEAWIGSSRFGPADSRTNTAELTLSNGLFSASQIGIAGFADLVPGTFNQYGGSNRIGSLGIGGGGIYSLYDGALNVTNSISLYGPIGFPGKVLVSGGTLRASSVGASDGHVTQSGGRAEFGNVHFSVGALDDGDYELSGGVLVSSNFIAVAEDRGSFNFHQSGGIHTNTGRIVVDGPGSRRGQSAYHFVNGLLFTPQLDLPTGLFFQEAGTSRVQRISLSGEGYYSQSGGAAHVQELSVTEVGSFQVRGGQLWTSNATAQLAVNWTPARPYIWLSGGEHHVERRLLLDSNGVYIISGGTLNARFITLARGGALRLDAGGIIATNELLIMRGGILFSAGGEYRFGGLRVPERGTIDFPSNPSTLRFTDAGDANPALNTELQILNWTPGSDHVYVGSNPQAIRPTQLSLIRFVNPGGYPPGTYRARVTSTGEIVPAELRTLAHTRYRDYMVLTWEPNYSLYSSTNVTGPYQQVVPASSPYTNSFTEPQRFFIVRPVSPPP